MAKAKAVKGCINENCIAKKEMHNFNALYEYCLRCGQPVTWVCKQCRTVLPDGNKRYCVRCENQIEDKKNHPFEAVALKLADAVDDIKDVFHKEENQDQVEQIDEDASYNGKV